MTPPPPFTQALRQEPEQNNRRAKPLEQPLANPAAYYLLGRSTCITREAFKIGWSNRDGIVSVNLKQKGQSMIAQLFKRRVGSESLMRQVVQGIVLLIAAIIFGAGFLKIAELELTEAQMFLGFGIVLSLVLQCCILWVLIDLKRKAA